MYKMLAIGPFMLDDIVRNNDFSRESPIVLTVTSKNTSCCQGQPYNRFVVHLHLPVIPTRTHIILEMMEAVGVPHNNFPSNNTRDKFDGTVTIDTYS